ncbi:SNF2-related protein [Vibrio barjaei]|uniref:SNF2-related protein n=1 Tax=Vibrio barjaei TaxID=1676683 RepID=UPI0022835E7C|nr:SNF2-related protein [Vibrio barjaei]MCY9870344.1 SNF2-related protein [Vibrio barjaei]
MTARFYGKIKFDGQQWVIGEAEPHVSIKLKSIFTKIPKYQTPPFYFVDKPDTAADLAWFIKRYPLEISAADKRKLNDRNRTFYREQESKELILSPEYIPRNRGSLKEGQALRRYQSIALDFIEKTETLILVDDVGLGKSYVALAIGTIDGTLPLAIVVEPHLQEQFLQKADEFIDLKVHGLKGNKPYKLPEADIYIIKYSQLAPWVDVLSSGWLKAIVFDECQQLRTGTDSAKGMAAKSICNGIKYRVGTSATPLYNYGIEIFNVMSFIRPGQLSSRAEFLREWCIEGNTKGIVKDPDALGAYLQENHAILRRKKEDVGQEAKQLAPILEWVRPDAKDLQDSQELAEKLAIQTLTGGFQESGEAARKFDLKMRELTGVAKAKASAAYARMMIENGSPVVLFGFHHEVYRIWANELSDLNPLFYTGGQTGAQKEKNKQAFINGESDLLIMSLRSGAGADGLQYRSSTVIFGELDWSSKIHYQCQGRLDRDGQTEPVFTIYIVTEFGSDPTIIDINGLKESQSSGIVDPNSSPVELKQPGDRIKLLARYYLESRGISLPDSQSRTLKDQSTEEIVQFLNA